LQETSALAGKASGTWSFTGILEVRFLIKMVGHCTQCASAWKLENHIVGWANIPSNLHEFESFLAAFSLLKVHPQGLSDHTTLARNLSFEKVQPESVAMFFLI